MNVYDRIINDAKTKGGGTYKVALTLDNTIDIKIAGHQIGFYVARRGLSEEFDTLSIEDTDKFIHTHIKDLETAYLGVWRDPRNNKFYLEVTKYYTDRTTARAMMRIEDQAYVFDIANRAAICYLDMFNGDK